MHLALTILFAFFASLAFTLLSYRYFQFIQLGGYTKHRFFKSVFSKDILSYVLNLITALSCLLLYFLVKDYTFISIIVFFIVNALLIFRIFKAYKKIPLKLTKRMARQIVLFFAVCLAGCFISCYFNYIVIAYSLQPALFALAIVSMYIILPLENLIKFYYKIRAVKKLNKNKSLIKIGITGSYGKTAVKNILHKMLEHKYNVLSTPKSFNTPMGVASCVLRSLTNETQVFICEMGARHRGDIKELCNMVKPAYAVISTIGNQHLETFKNLQNIKSEKFELALASQRANGYAFFSGDNISGIELYESFSGNKFVCNMRAYDSSSTRLLFNTDELSYAEILDQSNSGSTFILHIDGFKLRCKTKLLGRHNINNIALAAAVAYKLDITLDNIKKTVKNLESVPHRLEIIKSGNGVTVIDDSFNSNTLGFKCALEVLRDFKAGRRILVTPGVVELGKAQFTENFKLAKFIAEAGDLAVLVGKENAKALEEGLKEEKFENYILVKNLNEAQEFLKTYLRPNDTVLFENDLPDNY